jgi:gas vesicle protein
MDKRQNFFIGAAVAAGLVGTLTSLLAPRRVNHGWAYHAKAAAEKILKKEKSNKHWMLGSITGGLVGITTALLFAPKSGKKLMQDLASPFLNEIPAKKSPKNKPANSKRHANSQPESKHAPTNAKKKVNKKKNLTPDIKHEEKT